MLSFLNPDRLARTYRDPISWAILAVDLFPLLAVLTMGWGATPLVFLYWLENLIIGAVTLARMVAASVKNGPSGLAIMGFLGPFFIVHYGMFCLVHGVFVSAFSTLSGGADGSTGVPDFTTPFFLIDQALSSGANMSLFVVAIIALQAFLFVQDYLLGGEFKTADVRSEMMAPYGRIIVLHIGIFAGAFALVALGEPMIGILALILLRALWGVALSVHRRSRLDAALRSKS